MGLPLGWLGRTVLGPVGWGTFAAALAPLFVAFWIATDPQLYYMGVEYVLSFMTLVLVGLVHLARLIARVWVVSLRRQRQSLFRRDGRRWVYFWGAAAAGALLIVFKVPMRVAFLVSRPALEKVIADVRANPSVSIQPGRRAGLFTVSRVSDYGPEYGSTILIHTNPSFEGGGFRFTPNGPERFGYNPGDEGPLWGPWYWFSND